MIQNPGNDRLSRLWAYLAFVQDCVEDARAHSLQAQEKIDSRRASDARRNVDAAIRAIEEAADSIRSILSAIRTESEHALRLSDDAEVAEIVLEEAAKVFGTSTAAIRMGKRTTRASAARLIAVGVFRECMSMEFSDIAPICGFGNATSARIAHSRLFRRDYRDPAPIGGAGHMTYGEVFREVADAARQRISEREGWDWRRQYWQEPSVAEVSDGLPAETRLSPAEGGSPLPHLGDAAGEDEQAGLAEALSSLGDHRLRDPATGVGNGEDSDRGHAEGS